MNRLRFLLLVVISISIIVSFSSPALSASSKLTQSEIQKIRGNIQKSREMCDKSMELYNNAREQSSISASNFSKTGISEFQQVHEMYEVAEEKFRQARVQFGDVWIKMQMGLDENDRQGLREGASQYNPGILLYNEGINLYNKANNIFRYAVERAKNSNHNAVARTRSNPNTSQKPHRAFSFPSITHAGNSSSEFPFVAFIILLGTMMTSIQALRDRSVYDKFILHPWSIMRHGKRHYTVITNGLIHADPMHLAINMMSFCFFAFLLERIVGHLDFLIIYFGSLFFSSTVVTLTNGGNGYYRALGASGAIAGIIFSYIMYKPTSTIRFMFAPMGVPAVVFAVFYLAYSWFMTKNKYDNIGHEAHLWGAVSGALITMALDPKVLEMFRGI